MFEIHIAVPVVAPEVMQSIFEGLAQAGLPKCKFFYQVENIRPMGESCHPAGTPPTGHDLENPGAMATVKVASYQEGRKLLLAGMQVLTEHGVHGNFEIEGLLGPSTPEYPGLSIEEEFPGYRQVPDAPAFENHIIWKGVEQKLPTTEQIVRFFETSVGTTPHQLVDFGRDCVVNPDTVVSRVATVYQPTREAVLAFAKTLASTRDTLGYKYAVGEQVILVGEPMG